MKLMPPCVGIRDPVCKEAGVAPFVVVCLSPLRDKKYVEKFERKDRLGVRSADELLRSQAAGAGRCLYPDDARIETEGHPFGVRPFPWGLFRWCRAAAPIAGGSRGCSRRGGGNEQ